LSASGTAINQSIWEYHEHSENSVGHNSCRLIALIEPSGYRSV